MLPVTVMSPAPWTRPTGGLCVGWVPSMATAQGPPLLALSHHPEPTHREVLLILTSKGTQNLQPQPALAPATSLPTCTGTAAAVWLSHFYLVLPTTRGLLAAQGTF